VVGGGYGKIKDTTFRIGHMGDHTLDELDKLLEVISDVMA
jgi:aspartate aminotransferase-like enzyme